MRKNKEYILCKQLSEWLRLQYPHLIFHFDYAGLNLSIVQATRMKAIQGQRGYPDLFIAEPRGQYHGLFIELKSSTAKVFKQDGSIYSDQHLQEQAGILAKLSLKGYRAVFGIGFTHTTEQIKKYLNQ